MFPIRYRNFVTIFAPFFILTFLNIRIVATLQSTTANGGVFAHLAGNLALEQSRRKVGGMGGKLSFCPPL